MPRFLDLLLVLGKMNCLDAALACCTEVFGPRGCAWLQPGQGWRFPTARCLQVLSAAAPHEAAPRR